MINVKNRTKNDSQNKLIVHFTHFHALPKILKKSLTRVKHSNLGAKSIKVRALPISEGVIAFFECDTFSGPGRCLFKKS